MQNDHFGKEYHELLIRQLFHIKQLSSVAEYIERFSELVDQLTTYESRTDPLYYTMHFIDGLKSEFKSAVLVQRPPILDTACVLALLQEEVSYHDKKKEMRKHDYFHMPRPPIKQSLPLSPPPKLEKVDDKRLAEQSRSRSVHDRLSALRAYRHAKGLYVKCAQKWSRDHKCPDSI